jgi:4-amino-4-deoxy-L-arabinose transferase-like glycosyltransferase
LAVVLLATIMIRGSVVWALRDSLNADPDGYRAVAENLVAHGTFGHGQVPTAYRPPLYPLVLAPCVWLTPWDRAAIGVLHVLFGALAAGCLFQLALRCVARPAAAAAAILVACDPILLAQSPLVMTETLAALLATATVLAMVRMVERPTLRRALAAGVAAGLASLCRPTFLPWAAVAAVAMLGMLRVNRPSIVGVAAYLVGFAAVLSPWAIRNQIQFGRPIVGTTHGGYTLLLANNEYVYRYLREGAADRVWQAEELNRSLPWKMPFASPADELAADKTAYAMAKHAIGQEPGMFVYSCLARVGRLWSPLPCQLAPDESPRRRMLRHAVGLWYTVESAWAILGVLLVLRRGTKIGQTSPATEAAHSRYSTWLFWLLMAACFTAVHAFYWTDLRMRAPVMPGVIFVATMAVAALPPRTTIPK